MKRSAERPTVRRRASVTLAVLATTFVGCQSPDGDGGLDRGSVSPVWAPGEEWRLEDQPLLTIGSLDGPEAIGTVGQFFPPAPGLALLDDGGIALADGQADEIRIYDASGTRIATAGRSGDGPGEFRGLRAIERFGGDSLLAWDSRAGFYVGRLSVFTSTGVFVRTVPLPPGVAVGSVAGVLRNGTALVELQSAELDEWEPPGVGEFRMPRLYQRIATTGELLGEFGPVPGREMIATGRMQTSLVYYGRDTHVAVGDRFIYTGDSGRFEIAVHDPETGTVLRRVSRPYDPVPVTAEEVSSRRERQRRSRVRADSASARINPALQQRLRAMQPDVDEIPARDTYNVFNRILEDGEENLWVRHQVSASDSVRTWSVFGPTGSWLGEVNIPIGLTVEAIGREEILVVGRDDLDVQYVHLYRLVKYEHARQLPDE